MARAVQIKVVRRDDEDFEHMMRRFKKAYQESGVLADCRRHEFYQSKSVRRRLKKEEAKKNRILEMRRNAFPDRD